MRILPICLPTARPTQGIHMPPMLTSMLSEHQPHRKLNSSFPLLLPYLLGWCWAESSQGCRGSRRRGAGALIWIRGQQCSPVWGNGHRVGVVQEVGGPP